MAPTHEIPVSSLRALDTLRHALMDAITRDDAQKIKAAVERGAPLHQHYYHGPAGSPFNNPYLKGLGSVNPVDWAALELRFRAAMQLLELGDGRLILSEARPRPKVLPECTLADQTKMALNVASLYGHLGLMRMLLERGASVGQKNLENESALYVAARAKKADAVALLLQYGAWAAEGRKEEVLYFAEAAGITTIIEKAGAIGALGEATQLPGAVSARGFTAMTDSEKTASAPGSARGFTANSERTARDPGSARYLVVTADSDKGAGLKPFARPETSATSTTRPSTTRPTTGGSTMASSRLGATGQSLVLGSSRASTSPYSDGASLPSPLARRSLWSQEGKSNATMGLPGPESHANWGWAPFQSLPSTPMAAVSGGAVAHPRPGSMSLSYELSSGEAKLRGELHRAIRKGDVDSIRALVGRGAPLDTACDLHYGEKGNCVDWACVCGKPEAALVLLELADAQDLGDALAVGAREAFFWSVTQGYTDVLKELLRRGADVGQPSPIKSDENLKGSALSVAVFGVRKEETLALLKYGAWEKEPQSRRAKLLSWASSRKPIAEAFDEMGICDFKNYTYNILEPLTLPYTEHGVWDPNYPSGKPIHWEGDKAGPEGGDALPPYYR